MTIQNHGEFAVEAVDLHYSYPEQKKQKKSSAKSSREPKKAPREALSGLSFKARRGMITGLLGPNGSGKSTCFKLISSQLKIQKGQLKILGQEIAHATKDTRAKMGVCFQSPSLDPILTITENLEIQASLYKSVLKKAVNERIQEVLNIFALKDRQFEKVASLSGGLARRVELAKTLLHEPQLIILDEPTSGVDPLLRRDFWNELEKLRDLGVSILVSTHLMDEAELCDEVLFISGGKLVAGGKVAQLKKDYGFEIVKAEFDLGLQEMNEVESLLRAKLVQGETLNRKNAKITVECRKPFEWLEWIKNISPGHVTQLEWAKPSLADIYFAKTGNALS